MRQKANSPFQIFINVVLILMVICVVARSEQLLGPYVNKAGQPALENNFVPLLNKSNKVVGPGHNSEIVKDDAGQFWMLYHGFDADDPDAGRKVYLDQITWDKNGWPQIRNRQPSASAAAPLFGEDAGVGQQVLGSRVEPAGYYRLNGQPLPSLSAPAPSAPGIVIEQFADGTARKVAVR